MQLKITSGRKWLGTLITRKWFLSSMSPAMCFQITRLKKWLGTLTTRIWFLVHLQVARSRKGLGTLITRKRFFTTMCSFMQLKMTSVRKWLGTLITRKWFLSSMSTAMCFQITRLKKWLGTLTIRIWFLFSLCFFILPFTENDLVHWSQGNRFSPEWVLLCFFKLRPFWKWVGTLITTKWFLSRMSSSMLLHITSLRIWLRTLIISNWHHFLQMTLDTSHKKLASL